MLAEQFSLQKYLWGCEVDVYGFRFMLQKVLPTAGQRRGWKDNLLGDYQSYLKSEMPESHT